MNNPNLITLSWLDLALAASLVLIAGGVSFALRLGLGKRLLLASIRTVVQLALIGQVLTSVFGLHNSLLVMTVVGVMVVAAGRAAVGRAARTFIGITPRAIITLVLIGLTITFTVTEVIVGVDPWYRPQYVIPLLGMVLGNSLTGLSLAIDHLLESFDARRAQIETELALGATRWEAAKEPISQAVRRGMIPIINSMTVVGIVSLPGMMTGQILAGAEPFEAVKYQAVIMFMLAASTALACVMMTLLSYQRLFSVTHQLRSDLLRKKD